MKTAQAAIAEVQAAIAEVMACGPRDVGHLAAIRV